MKFKNRIAAIIIITILILSFFFIIKQENKIVLKTISANDAKKLIDGNSKNELTILDVRTFDEYCGGHISGAANTPVETLENSPIFSTMDKDHLILVYSQNGQRGSQAGQIFVNNGFKKVYNLDGGVVSWANENFSISEPIEHTSEGCKCE
jgi:rhodanese-related sulfurtransferase